MKTIYIILALLLVNLQISAVQYSMPITWDGAQDNNLCWAACCQMILGFYGQTVEQSDIVQLGTGGVDTTNVLFQQSLEPWDSNSCAQIIYTFSLMMVYPKFLLKNSLQQLHIKFHQN